MAVLREIPISYCAQIRESANRPHLFMGCDPMLLGAAACFTALWCFSLMSFLGCLSGIAIFMFLLSIFRKMALAEPYFLSFLLDEKNWRQKRSSQKTRGFWPALCAAPVIADVYQKRK